MGKNSGTKWLLVGLVVVVLLFAFKGGNTQVESVVNGITGGNQQQTGECNLGRAATLQASSFDKLNGTLDNTNAELWKSDGTQQIPETSVAHVLTSLSSTAATTFNGYIMIGNDNFVSGTDRGDDLYYTKKAVSWNCEGNPTFAQIPVYKEGTLTVTVYDDGAAEATPNITVGTSNVDSTEIKITTSALSAFGNPAFDNPVAVCFNSTTIAAWDQIRPIRYSSILKVPGFLSGKNVVGDCYVLSTGALVDSPMSSAEYKFAIRFDPAAADPTNEWVTAIFLDRTYYKDDQGKWTDGFGKESDLVADTDVGSPIASDQKDIIIY